jgi:hypothetical protein
METVMTLEQYEETYKRLDDECKKTTTKYNFLEKSLRAINLALADADEAVVKAHNDFVAFKMEVKRPNPPLVTADTLKEYIRTTAPSNFVTALLLSILERQTAEEKECRSSLAVNGAGFTKPDAKILTGIAAFYKERKYITYRQEQVLRHRLPKYAGQLLKIADLPK